MADAILHEVFVSFSKDACAEVEILVDCLINAGVDAADIVESFQKSEHRVSVYFPTAARAGRIFRHIRKLMLPGVSVRRKIVRKEDWADRWKKDFKPFAISKRLEVVPAWLKSKHQTRRRHVPLYIDTTLAFGTGLHETTQFMVQLIERCQGRFETFLDIGTGTGILTVAGLHCGAKRVTAIDISADAVKIARDNLQINGFPAGNGSVKVLVKDIGAFSRSDRFDFVAANLVTHDLIANADQVLRLVKPGGYLAVSGISIPNGRLFRKTFDRLPLKCLKILKGETWLAFLYKKKELPLLRLRGG